MVQYVHMLKGADFTGQVDMNKRLHIKDNKGFTLKLSNVGFDLIL